MIDTDKYEGHNLNVKPKDIQTYGHFNDEGKRDATIFFIPDNNFENSPSIIEANVHLLADAPLLLAEVKRLREELRITQSNFSMVRNALANQYPKIEEAIWKVIE